MMPFTTHHLNKFRANAKKSLLNPWRGWRVKVGCFCCCCICSDWDCDRDIPVQVFPLNCKRLMGYGCHCAGLDNQVCECDLRMRQRRSIKLISYIHLLKMSNEFESQWLWPQGQGQGSSQKSYECNNLRMRWCRILKLIPMSNSTETWFVYL